jgi:phage-related protein
MRVIPTADVYSFIEQLPIKVATRTQGMIRVLEENGHKIRMPYSKSLGEGLFELRILGNIQVRVLYFFSHDAAYLVHAFVKKSMRIPKSEIEYGRTIWKTLLNNT